MSANRERRGRALEAGGTTAAGVGLIAGGVPGTREPNALRVMHLRKTNAKLSASTLRQLAPQPRAGILGWRGNAHQAFIGFNQGRTDGSDYVKGNRAGKLASERQIVRGMRIARRGSYGLTIGGGAAALAGAKQKRDAVGKRDTRAERYSTSALAAGGTGLALSGGAGEALRRYERGYERSAVRNLQRAQRLAPNVGGPGVRPAKVSEATGKVKRPAKLLMTPQRTDAQLRATRAADKIAPEHRHEVGRLRGVAAQEKHFAEVFGTTGRAVRRFRGPSAALAGAGAAGLAASNDARHGFRKRAATPLKATEFESGNSHEGYSGEAKRRRVAASAMGWGGAAALSGAGASAALGAGSLGRPGAQAGLSAARRQYPAAAKDITRLKRIGQEAAKRPKTVLAGAAALGATSALTGRVARFRNGEEDGISQGLGRIKAGEAYRRDQARLSGVAKMSEFKMFGIAGQLAHDPQVQQAARWASTHRKPLGIGAAAAAGSTAMYQGAARGKRRLAERRAVRAEVQQKLAKRSITYGYEEKRTSPVRVAAGAVGIAGLAWGGSRLGMTGRAAAKGARKLGYTPGQGRSVVDSVRRQTGHAENVLRGRVPGFGTALDTIPRPVRAATVTGAGGALTIASMPWSTKTFHSTER